jgi:beta-lactamase superfamily II metal-dependent hydrolase
MKLTVTFLDCKSHGDCSVITFDEDNETACIVIDGGESRNSSEALSNYLKNEGVKKINLLIGTHIDADHINGLKYFVQEQAEKKEEGNSFIEIDEFWGPMPSKNFGGDFLPNYSKGADEPDYNFSWQDFVIQSVKQNDDLIDALTDLNVKLVYPALDNPQKNPFKNISIKLFNPDTQIPADSISKKALGIPNDINVIENELDLNGLKKLINGHYERMAKEAKRNANNQSIVVKIALKTGVKKAKDWSFLFTGDAEEEAWEGMLDNRKVSKYLKSYVLKIPHHGSENGITKKGLKKVDPKYSVNLVGQKHGLPDEEILKNIQDNKSEILCPIRNQSSKHKSACFNIPSNECPAKNNSSDIKFVIDSNTGSCKIFPNNRECKYNWK